MTKYEIPGVGMDTETGYVTVIIGNPMTEIDRICDRYARGDIPTIRELENELDAPVERAVEQEYA